MNRNKIVSRMLLGIAILVGGVLASGFVISSAQAAGRAQLPYPPDGSHSGTMDGGEHRGYGTSPTTGITGTVPYRATGCPGMGGWGWGYSSTGTPLTIDQATDAVQQYLTAYGNPDPSAGSGQALALTEVMEFSNNFYAEVKEESTGVHAFELLINRYTGAVYPEMGPNMMWNTKYGHMGGWGGMRGMMGMMGMTSGWWGTPTVPDTMMPVTAAQARRYAQEYLDVYRPGTTVADEADAFYGYYTIHVLRDGQIYGMLSVNGTSGQVWYHTWHGDFIGMREFDEKE